VSLAEALAPFFVSMLGIVALWDFAKGLI